MHASQDCHEATHELCCQRTGTFAGSKPRRFVKTSYQRLRAKRCSAQWRTRQAGAEAQISLGRELCRSRSHLNFHPMNSPLGPPFDYAKHPYEPRTLSTVMRTTSDFHTSTSCVNPSRREAFVSIFASVSIWNMRLPSHFDHEDPPRIRLAVQGSQNGPKSRLFATIPWVTMLCGVV